MLNKSLNEESSNKKILSRFQTPDGKRLHRPKPNFCSITPGLIKEITQQTEVYKIHSLSLQFKDERFPKIRTIEGLDNLINLRHLDLSYNLISRIENIANLRLKTLNLAHNNIREIENLEKVNSLENINLSFNYIQELGEGLNTLNTLKTLNLEKNLIKDLEEVKNLSLLINLKIVTLKGNPISGSEIYKDFCIYFIYAIEVLDNMEIDDQMKSTATGNIEELFQREAEKFTPKEEQDVSNRVQIKRMIEANRSLNDQMQSVISQNMELKDKNTKLSDIITMHQTTPKEEQMKSYGKLSMDELQSMKSADSLMATPSKMSISNPRSPNLIKGGTSSLTSHKSKAATVQLVKQTELLTKLKKAHNILITQKLQIEEQKEKKEASIRSISETVNLSENKITKLEREIAHLEKSLEPKSSRVKRSTSSRTTQPLASANSESRLLLNLGKELEGNQKEARRLHSEINRINNQIEIKKQHLKVLRKQLNERSQESYFSDSEEFMILEEKASSQEIAILEKEIKSKTIKYKEYAKLIQTIYLQIAQIEKEMNHVKLGRTLSMSRTGALTHKNSDPLGGFEKDRRFSKHIQAKSMSNREFERALKYEKRNTPRFQEKTGEGDSRVNSGKGSGIQAREIKEISRGERKDEIKYEEEAMITRDSVLETPNVIQPLCKLVNSASPMRESIPQWGGLHQNELLYKEITNVKEKVLDCFQALSPLFRYYMERISSRGEDSSRREGLGEGERVYEGIQRQIEEYEESSSEPDNQEENLEWVCNSMSRIKEGINLQFAESRKATEREKSLMIELENRDKELENQKNTVKQLEERIGELEIDADKDIERSPEGHSTPLREEEPSPRDITEQTDPSYDQSPSRLLFLVDQMKAIQAENLDLKTQVENMSQLAIFAETMKSTLDPNGNIPIDLLKTQITDHNQIKEKYSYIKKKCKKFKIYCAHIEQELNKAFINLDICSKQETEYCAQIDSLKYENNHLQVEANEKQVKLDNARMIEEHLKERMLRHKEAIGTLENHVQKLDLNIRLKDRSNKPNKRSRSQSVNQPQFSKSQTDFELVQKQNVLKTITNQERKSEELEEEIDFKEKISNELKYLIEESLKEKTRIQKSTEDLNKILRVEVEKHNKCTKQMNEIYIRLHSIDSQINKKSIEGQEKKAKSKCNSLTKYEDLESFILFLTSFLEYFEYFVKRSLKERQRLRKFHTKKKQFLNYIEEEVEALTRSWKLMEEEKQHFRDIIQNCSDKYILYSPSPIRSKHKLS